MKRCPDSMTLACLILLAVGVPGPASLHAQVAGGSGCLPSPTAHSADAAAGPFSPRATGTVCWRC